MGEIKKNIYYYQDKVYELKAMAFKYVVHEEH
jgi:hypothetical protein